MEMIFCPPSTVLQKVALNSNIDVNTSVRFVDVSVQNTGGANEDGSLAV